MQGLRLSARRQLRSELVDERALALVELVDCLAEAEPSCSIDFGEVLGLPRPWRPFEFDHAAVGVARLNGIDIEISLDGERVQALLAGTERIEPERLACRRGSAHLFVELAESGRVWRLDLWIELAFGNRPRVRVLLGPERTAGVHKQDFDVACMVGSSPDNDAGGGRWSGTTC